MGLSTEQLEHLRQVVGEIAKREGCLLYDVEFTTGPQRTLRVYIEKENGGASLDDCVNVSRGLDLALDVEDLIPGASYDLEVSTPGLERKLTQNWHFQKAAGQAVRLNLIKGEKPAVVEGIVLSADDVAVKVEVKGQPVDVEFDKIAKAKQLFKPQPSPKKPKGKRG